MRKPYNELTFDSQRMARSECRQLWLREQAGFASPEDIEKRKFLEKYIGQKAKTLKGPGQPRKVQ